ncbi:hypothetical protein V8C44DRAFT_337110 [Trichoderma aethiopicum]
MDSHGPDSDKTRVAPTTEHLLDDMETMRGLPRDDSPPWSTHHLRGTNAGLGQTTCPKNGYEPSSSDDTNVSTPSAIDLGHGLIDITSTMDLDLEAIGLDLDSGIADVDAIDMINNPSPDSQNGCKAAHDAGSAGNIGKPFLAYLGGRAQAACDGKSSYYHAQVELDDEGVDDRGKSAPPRPHLMAGILTAAERPQQSPDLVPTRNTIYSFVCVTETLGCAELRIGWHDHIPRWARGSVLSYIMCKEDFPTELSSVVEDAMKEAISSWPGIDVSFKQVPRGSRATFAVRFDGSKFKSGYAESFMPDNTRPLALFVYEKSRSKAEYLPNILAHEIGHILGIRHGFAERRREPHSVSIGSEDDRSIMLYRDHPRELKVSELDLHGLKLFYDYDQAEYDGLPIVTIKPELHDLNEASI